MEVYNVQINHLHHPVGIDGKNWRITWCLKDGVSQSAYEVQVKDSCGTILEDSGKTASGQMFHTLKRTVPYRTLVTVTVSVWDENRMPGLPSSLEAVTGIGQDGWKAKWIDPELSRDKKIRPASYLRKTFHVDSVPEERWAARLYITSHGIFTVTINGKELTDAVLMPGSCQENRRLCVETLDATPALQAGDNTIVVVLGNGWHRGSMGFDQRQNVFGSDVALFCQLEIDGQVKLVSDESWQASQDGPLGENDFMAGEKYDARKEDTMTFHPVRIRNYGTRELICNDTVPVRPHETFQPELLTTPAGEKVLDFGQNLAGYVSFCVQAKEGQKIRLVHGETLDARGNFTIANFQAPKHPVRQEVNYICKEGGNCYHPTMTYMGFRYVKVETDIDIHPENFTAVAIYSDMRETTSFACGVPEVNKLFSNTMWSMKSNFVEVPTDCPTREKSGFSGDCQVFSKAALMLMDCYPVLAKWLREQEATQMRDGCVAQIAPSPSRKKTFMDGGIGWSDSFILVPWRMSAEYGDDSILREHYPAMKRFMEYQFNRSKKVRFRNRKAVPKKYRPYVMDHGWLWGEWQEPGVEVSDVMSQIVFNGDLELSTAYLSEDCEIMAGIAQRLGFPEDHRLYSDYNKKCREAYHYLFLPHGKIEEPVRQCRYVRPIAKDVLTEDEKMETAKSLAELISRNQNRLNTGFLTTADLCRALSDYGQASAAYDLLLQRDAPGWLFPVLQGATTIPENWFSYGKDGEKKDSLNHYSYGAVAGWLVDSVCGIRLSPGKLTIRPCPDKRLGFARAEWESPIGKIVSGWKYRDDGSVQYEIEVPPNAVAEVELPEGKKCTVRGRQTING